MYARLLIAWPQPVPLLSSATPYTLAAQNPFSWGGSPAFIDKYPAILLCAWNVLFFLSSWLDSTNLSTCISSITYEVVFNSCRLLPYPFMFYSPSRIAFTFYCNYLVMTTLSTSCSALPISRHTGFAGNMNVRSMSKWTLKRKTVVNRPSGF